jgi:uncharacterized SAM-binding protein YcdF (DUF218 family)
MRAAKKTAEKEKMKHKILILFGFVSMMGVFIWLGGFLAFSKLVFSYQTTGKEIIFQQKEGVGVAALTGGRNRIAKALDLAKIGVGEKLLISGVKPGITKADIAAREDVHEADLANIELGYTATDTVGNAREVQHWAAKHHLNKVYVVTSFYHIPRVRLEFENEMKNLELHYVAVGSDHVLPEWWKSWRSFSFLALQYSKFLVVYAQYKLF